MSRRIAVIGAGVIGVTTAWELAEDGHEVTVFEARGGVAGQTSFAPAGLAAPDWTLPWTAPASAWSFWRQALGRGGDWELASRLDLAAWQWLRRWRRATRIAPAGGAFATLRALAHDSRVRRADLARRFRFDYERAEGCLVLLRDEAEVSATRGLLGALAETGARFSLLDASQCRRLEPGLQPDTPLQAGVHLPDAESGNVRVFTQHLRSQAQLRGVRFLFQSAVRRLRAQGGGLELDYRHGRDPSPADLAAGDDPDTGPSTQPMPAERRTEQYDDVVLCNGHDARRLLKPLGLRLPIEAVWGTTITAPLRHFEAHPDAGPRAGLIDLRDGVAMTRAGQRVRIAGGLRVGRRGRADDERDVDRLYRCFDDWFPGTTQVQQVQRWQGARWCAPDGLPRIGPTPTPGLWLNLGHGAHGWALASGSALRLTQLLRDRAAAR